MSDSHIPFEGLSAMGEACIALPGETSANTPVVLYLHGIFPSDFPQQSLIAQRELGQMATARGFALLVPADEALWPALVFSAGMPLCFEPEPKQRISWFFVPW